MIGLAVVVLMPAIATAHSGESYVVCNLDPNGDNFLALRACGATKCEMLMKLGPNTGLLAIGPDGWVYDKYICEVAD